MEIDEAFHLLGVEPGIAEKALHRAYLRKVKGCSPERDPAGFQRIREAYELARVFSPRQSEEAAPAASELPLEVLETPAPIRATGVPALSSLVDRVERGQRGSLPEILEWLESSVHGTSDVMPSADALDRVVLHALAASNRDAARRVVAAWQARSEGLGVDFVRDPAAVVLQAGVRELCEAPADISEGTLAIMARALLGHDPRMAAPALAELAEERPFEAGLLADYMRTSAPALQQLFGAEVPQASEPDEAPWSRGRETVVRVVFAVAVFGWSISRCIMS